MVDYSCAGTHTVSVQVNGDDGDPVADKQVTIINKKTGDQVFTGTTDNAGQINVTLPRGQYEVVAGSQSKQVNLNKDQDVTFTLPTDELPKAQ
ncbi:carboxypeptidase-like regulatory domain-containing protein [Haladaptatus sp. DYF46]|uniref:SpaA isopeptide-forming pilin-related protein n=1 Tax=Haladaptatus sp. DYF46 TaxID=2886041 RepID=UPI001E4CFC8E|nr:carboxypeptidase-like regulatory domain-containing protein [Haladaptatus sp. DYF46]